jgi:poly-gamma-glutamate capsule biosynthesis protein CapA/YwtB (metallophosphatase superfamily)
LFAHASGALPLHAAAEANKPGVNELKVSVNEVGETIVDETDAVRILSAITAAREELGPHGVILVSHHNHQFSYDVTVGTLYHLHDKRAFTVPAWQKVWVERLMQAGATIYLGHGNPNFAGMGLVMGRPAFYSLGNFIFEIQGDGHDTFGHHAWQGITANLCLCTRDGPKLTVRIQAVSIESDPKSSMYGLPSTVDDTVAMKTLHRFVKLSKSEANVDFVMDEHRRAAVLTVPYSAS